MTRESRKNPCSDEGDWSALAPILDAVREPLFVKDREHRLVWVNREFCELSGKPADELIGSRDLDLVDEADVASLTAEDEEAIDTLGQSGQELSFRGHDGSTLPLSVKKRAVETEAGRRLLVCVAHDLSGIRERFQADLRLDALGRLAGGVAHDFNNLLTVILGHCELALDGVVADPKPILSIIETSRRAAELTGALVTFSRNRPMERRVLDLAQVVRDMEKMISRMLREDVELRVFDDAAGRVEADRGMIEQALLRLIANAQEALLPGGGRIEIVTDNVTLASGDHVRVRCTDDGRGMDARTREQAFDPYFSTKASRGSVGLGLPAVHGIVKQHGGNVRIESVPGRGTTVELLFARTEAPLEPCGLPGTAPHAAQEGRQILLVEDEPSVREVTRQILESLGYRVTCTESPQDAIDLASSPRREIDLVFTDVVMPGMNGVSLARRLCRVCPEVPVLFASGYSEAEIPDLDRTRVQFISKPYSRESLGRAIDRALKAR